MESHRSPRRRRPSSLLAALGALLLPVATVTAVTAPAAHADVPPAPEGWNHVWSDDFDGPAGSLPDSENWIVDTGTSYPGGPANWGTGEVQTYTDNPENLALDGQGNLRITPRRDASGQWTSARIETRRSDFKPADGETLRIEGRLQVPDVSGEAALGYWPAFWALGSPYRGEYWNWPGVGEFDIMENVNGINRVWGVLHCGVSPGGPCNETEGLGASRVCPGSSCQSAFHTYRFEWDRSGSSSQLRWYVDGQQYHSVDESQIGASAWSDMTSHAGYFILLNVAMGGAFPDGVQGSATPTAATQPGYPMVVDYVSVWETGSGGGGTPTDPPGDGGDDGGGVDARSTIQGEDYQAQTGTALETTSDTGGGQNVAQIGDGDRLRFDDVEFGTTAAGQFKARVASGAAAGVSGLVEVRLDSATAAPVASFAVADTGGWQSWRTVPANMSAVTGTHDVYITFSSGQPADFVNLNWFTFSSN
ncbi:glycoside hydrolase family 16 protein [Streptomonospora litoralis]|uniref:Glucan endo-1,3-beta-glucosidase A1 n=1 Tax=Streptomonospora litoralis TaxID=2498135 RepID=A0A4P6Q2Z0_9ACTN|nr:glycoside hydrolase family 16 protein [Streptomonospora litoralis]QBI54903.1 Glucan endo-1,3-beta-glucosidase A1 precursor [Streptomonospora litoralis]